MIDAVAAGVDKGDCVDSAAAAVGDYDEYFPLDRNARDDVYLDRQLFHHHPQQQDHHCPFRERSLYYVVAAVAVAVTVQNHGMEAKLDLRKMFLEKQARRYF